MARQNHAKYKYYNVKLTATAEYISREIKIFKLGD